MKKIKVIFIVGVLIIIFPMLGFPFWFENLLLIIMGIILIISSLNLRKDIPSKKEINPESTSFAESDVDDEKEEDVNEK